MIALGGTYSTRGSNANFVSSGRAPVSYGMPAGFKHYALAGQAIAFSSTVAPPAASAPQQMWPGYVTSTHTQYAWWPPADGSVPDSYNTYQDGVRLNANPIFPTLPLSTGILYTWRSVTGLTPSTTYTFTARAVYGGTESPDSPALVVTTLPGNATPVTLPAPPTVPETFIPAYSIPTTVTTATQTVWLATQTSGSAAGTDNGVAGNHKLSVSCSFPYALLNAIAGDVIVLTAGATYTSSSGSGYAFDTGAIGSSAGYIYITTTQDPGYNPAGKLPAYSYVPSKRYQPFTATAAIAAGATGLTLTAPFIANKTGWYTTKFASANPSGVETRQALYQVGQTSVVWNVGLQAACAAAFQAEPTNHVTPWDAGVPIGPGNVTNPSPTMATIQFTQSGLGGNGGFGFNVHGTNIRVVGINVQPRASWLNQVNILNGCTALGGLGNMFDRCVIGRDNTNASTLSFFFKSIGCGGTNAVVHQCYLYGADSGNNSSQDTQAIGIGSGGPVCIQNTYVEACDEGIISGGTRIPQNIMQHDMTIRYNTCHKQTTWQQVFVAGTNPVSPSMSVSRRVKNHLELKVGQRFEWYGNLIQNNALLQSSQGQGARAFVMTPRDQWSATAVRQILSATWAAGKVTVNTTFSHSIQSSLFTTTITNAPRAGYNGTFLCTVTGPTTFTYLLATDPGGAVGTFTGYQSVSQSGGMWMHITDGYIHDNQIYGTGGGPYAFTSNDYCPILYSARIRYENNLEWINPAFTDDLNNKTPMHGMEFQGQVADFTFRHNTVIFAPQAFGYTVAGPGPIAMVSYQSGTANTLNDRWTVTDNVMDGNPNLGAIQSSGGTSPPNITSTGGLWVRSCWDTTTQTTGTLTWDKNLLIFDTSSGGNAFPGTTYNPVAYSSVGFNNFINNTTEPLDPSDYNVVSGTYVTAATDGSPLGSQFHGAALMTDPFPRTHWQATVPVSGGGYGSTFQTNAAKFNIVNPGPYMGIEQSMGTTFATIFAAIKSQSKANGFATSTRCVHYTMSSEQSTVGGAGNSSTYTVWSSVVDGANWWLRTSWPAGSIVTFDANSGVTAISSSPNVPLSGGGKTIFRAYWDHYDGVLRLGNAVAQGYGAGVALAPNPYVDGYQLDNAFCQPRSTGAWNFDTTSYVSHWPTSADPTQSAFIQQAQASQVAALRATNRNLIVIGNTDYFIHSTGNFSYAVALDPAQNGLWDVVYCENVIGSLSGSIEGQGTTTTAQMMANLIAAEAQIAAGGTLVLEQTGRNRTTAFTSTNQASWVAADWQAARFGLGCACMRNYHFALNNNQDYRPDRPYFMDEFLAQGGRFGWLGAALDQPQSAARTAGVWYRVFAGGVVFMNPAGNGTQTITLASLGLSGLKAISNVGFGDASINTGAAVTSITLLARDGRFLTI